MEPSRKVLLDTNAFLLAGFEWSRLSGDAREILADEETSLLLSVVSIWQCATKAAVGKLLFEPDTTLWVRHQVAAMRLDVLPVLWPHCETYAGIPLLPGHRDPFDRMLVAQAISEGVPILSGDRALRAYDVEVIW
jgi:PIN domain nuclease of toxin-antitoxin system